MSPSDTLTNLVSEFENQRVLVLGDAILDEYLFGDCSRISPEAPVPVLKINSCQRVLGGAANTAANIRSLGGQATLLALLGQDEGGATLKYCAAGVGIDLIPVLHGAPTLRKTRVVAQQQQIVRLDYEDSSHTGSHYPADRILSKFEQALPDCHVVVISDYGKGFLSAEVARAVIARAHAAGRRVIVDPRPQNRAYYRGCDYLTPNWRESRGLLGLPDADPSDANVSAVATALARELDTNVVLTLGPQGISFCSRDTAERFAVPTFAREVFDVSGAGDTVVAAFALSIAAGANHVTAVTVANRAASVVVGKFGTATVSAAELLESSEEMRLVPRGHLRKLSDSLRAKGRRIVTVNGTFDLLHAGHLYLLREARSRGDVLILGLNSDHSVRGNKGFSRPIVPQGRRAEMLLALRMVDYVHIFDEPEPSAFVAEVRPHVHVNGAEYGENCVEAETVRRHGGELFLVDRIPDLSTSGLVELMASASAGYPRKPAASLNDQLV